MDLHVEQFKPFHDPTENVDVLRISMSLNVAMPHFESINEDHANMSEDFISVNELGD
jgi:hypothetical protein